MGHANEPAWPETASHDPSNDVCKPKRDSWWGLAQPNTLIKYNLTGISCKQTQLLVHVSYFSIRHVTPYTRAASQKHGVKNSSTSGQEEQCKEDDKVRQGQWWKTDNRRNSPNYLYTHDYWSITIPELGTSARRREKPQILVKDQKCVTLLEVKSTGRFKLSITKDHCLTMK